MRKENFLMDRAGFVLHVSDMSEIINVEASMGGKQKGALKRFLIWVSGKCFPQRRFVLDLIFLIDSRQNVNPNGKFKLLIQIII